MDKHQSGVNESSSESTPRREDHAKRSKIINGVEGDQHVGEGDSKNADANKKRNNKSRNNKRGRNDSPDVQLSKSLSWLLRHTAPSLGLHPTSDGYIPVKDILSLNHPRFVTQSKRAKYTVQDVERVVENCAKQRFRLEYKNLSREKTQQIESHDNDAITTDANNCTTSSSSKDNQVLCIRANQGHSYKDVIESDKLLTPLTKGELSDPTLNIIHGTTRKAWDDHIRIEGLSRMKRNHIHFASGLPESISVSTADNGDERKKKIPPISGMRSTSQIYIYVNGAKCATDGIKFFRSDNGVILTAGENDEGLLPVKYFKKVVLASSGKILHDGDD